MEKVVLIDEKWAEVWYEPENTLGMILWKAPCSTEQYRSAFMALINHQYIAKITRFLSDVRNQGVVSPDNRKWFEKEALPRAIRNGLKAAAVVVSANPFKKYYLNTLLKTINKFNLPLKLFSTEEDARKWLYEKAPD